MNSDQLFDNDQPEDASHSKLPLLGILGALFVMVGFVVVVMSAR